MGDEFTEVAICSRVQYRLLVQHSLFGRLPIAFDGTFLEMRRIPLEDGAWLDLAPGWLEGHEALFDLLLEEARFTAHRRLMYDRVVDVPRLLGRAPTQGRSAALLREIARALERRYGMALPSITLAHYRDGRDGVAMHGDKMGSLVDDTIVVVLSLGHPRRFLIKPVRGGSSRAFTLGGGDLLVMGGTCQKTHVHGVPKVAEAGGRISVMFRPAVPEASAEEEARARLSKVRRYAALSA